MSKEKVTLRHYAAAGYAAVAIATSDEDRAVASVIAAFPKRLVMRVAAIGGVIDARTGDIIAEKEQYPAAFGRAANTPQSVLIMLDFQHSIKQPAPYRILRDILPRLKSADVRSLVVLVA